MFYGTYCFVNNIEWVGYYCTRTQSNTTKLKEFSTFCNKISNLTFNKSDTRLMAKSITGMK